MRMTKPLAYIYASLTRISDLERNPNFDVRKLDFGLGNSSNNSDDVDEIDTNETERWETGDYVVGRYVCDNHKHAFTGPPNSSEDFAELSTGRHRFYNPGDLVVGVLGCRCATKETCGDWHELVVPTRQQQEQAHEQVGSGTDEVASLINECDKLTKFHNKRKRINNRNRSIIMSDLCGSGLFGKETSRSSRESSHPNFEYVGHVMRHGKKVCMDDFVPKLSPHKQPPHEQLPQEILSKLRNVPTILVVGTSMSCGKSCTARVIIHTLKQMLGHDSHVVGAKLTGAGYYNDILSFKDAGADEVFDFVDVGLPSTVMPQEEYKQRLYHLLDMICDKSDTAAKPQKLPDVLVVEAGASPCENYNGNVVLDTFNKLYRTSQPQQKSNNLFVVLCANDPYAVAGFQKLSNLSVDMVSGVISNTKAGRELIENMNHVRTLSLATDASIGELVELMTNKLYVLKKRMMCIQMEL